MSTEKQMIGPRALGIVASVATQHTFGNRAIVKRPRIAMGQRPSLVNAQQPISKLVDLSRPRPAFIWSVLANVPPVAGFNRRTRVNSSRHSLPSKEVRVFRSRTRCFNSDRLRYHCSVIVQ